MQQSYIFTFGICPPLETASLCHKRIFFFKAPFSFLDLKLLPESFIGSRHVVGIPVLFTAVDLAVHFAVDLIELLKFFMTFICRKLLRRANLSHFR